MVSSPTGSTTLNTQKQPTYFPHGKNDPTFIAIRMHIFQNSKTKEAFTNHSPTKTSFFQQFADNMPTDLAILTEPAKRNLTSNHTKWTPHIIYYRCFTALHTYSAKCHSCPLSCPSQIVYFRSVFSQFCVRGVRWGILGNPPPRSENPRWRRPWSAICKQTAVRSTPKNDDFLRYVASSVSCQHVL